jgi:hypothetical protein
VPDIPLNASEILACLGEVAEALPATGPRHTIVVVGGSLLALHGLRQTTLDVDTVWPIEEELREAVARVARPGAGLVERLFGGFPSADVRRTGLRGAA